MAALTKWGPKAQITMVFEEMAELQKELCKYLRGEKVIENITEEIVDFPKTRPCESGDAHGAGFMGGEENALRRVRVPLELVEQLDGIHLSVPEGRKGFVIRPRHHQGEVVLPEHRRAEDLAADSHSAGGQGHDIPFDHIKHAVKQLFLLHTIIPFRRIMSFPTVYRTPLR